MRRVVVLSAIALALSSLAHAGDAVRPEDRGGTARPVSAAGTPFGNALRLAHMLSDDQTIARLLSARAMAPNATVEEVEQAMVSLETIGAPDQALKLLHQRLARFPKEVRTRVMLAQLLERDSQSTAAAAVWKDLDRDDPFALTPAQVLEYERDLARTGKTETAYDVLKAHAYGLPPDEVEFWHDLATLAWELEDDAVALDAYRKVWMKAPTTVNVASRLMTLAKEAGSLEEALQVALADYAVTKEPTTLLFAADLEATRARWASAKQIISLADDDVASFSKREQYWMLRGEVFGELGDEATAYAAYRMALSLRPDSTSAQAAILWHEIDHDDVVALRRDLDLWRPYAVDSDELWKPFALGLDRIGRSRDAMRFYVRAWRAHPDDDALTIDFADVLERTGEPVFADRLRRHVMGKRQASALAALVTATPTPDDLALLASHIEHVRVTSGVAMGERWLTAARAAHPTSKEIANLSLITYFDERRLDRARPLVPRQDHDSSERTQLQGYRLELAIEDDDYREVKRLLTGNQLSMPSARARAFEFLGKDDDEASSLKRVLTDEPSADQPAAARRLREIEARHAPSALLGATYTYYNGLSAVGPDAAAAHDLGPFRVLYSAWGRSMSLSPGTPAHDDLTLTHARAEAEFGGVLRRMQAHSVTELGAGINYQPDRVVPRATFFDERTFGRVLSTRVDVVFDDKIEDTPFLRLEAVRSRATLGVRADLVKRVYVSAALEGLEDHTRRFDHLALGLEESAEAGVKIARGDPEWDVGVQVVAAQRQNASSLTPTSLAALTTDVQLTQRDCLGCYLPPSYQMISVVTHLTRGDFEQRYRPDNRPFPRYDCDAGIGVILPRSDAPSSELAAHLQCAASFRVVGTGFVSGTGYYNRGIAGIGEDQNAAVSIFYTQPL